MTAAEGPTLGTGQVDRLQQLQRSAAATVAGLVLVQAFLAGRHLFGTWGISVHGVAGNVTFGLGLLIAAVVVLRRMDRTSIVVSSLLAVALTAQVGLGYAGRTSLDAAAWHIPNGVLAFGLAVFLAVRPGTTADGGASAR